MPQDLIPGATCPQVGNSQSKPKRKRRGPKITSIKTKFSFPASPTKEAEGGDGALRKSDGKLVVSDQRTSTAHGAGSAPIRLPSSRRPHQDVGVVVQLVVWEACFEVSGPFDQKPDKKIVGNAQFRWQRTLSEDYGVMGLRYGSANLSAGATFTPLSIGTTDGARYKNLANWSCAIGYGLGSRSPLSPSFNFGLELAKNSQFIASFYQHVVVQRRYLILNDVLPPDSYYLDAACAQHLGKIGPHSSSAVFAFKSWWKPSFTLSLSATRDHIIGKTGLGFGIHVDNLREASYQRADPNFVMLTPNKEHLAEGIYWKIGKKPMFQSDVNSGNFDGVPRELRPLDKIL
ncbi:hypothetical protein RJ640_024331 [Escallonia rubra]|uniref:Uncharacterized protein n=1 Tax=Escallonia rubra TaxID=112253 RepID=A0AA88UWH4_9ASTE|nr:hypothetical protein RJ640_024331 [Escallonia rubra]